MTDSKTPVELARELLETDMTMPAKSDWLWVHGDTIAQALLDAVAERDEAIRKLAAVVMVVVERNALRTALEAMVVRIEGGSKVEEWLELFEPELAAARNVLGQ